MRLTIEICEAAWARVLDLAMVERRTAREQAGWLLEGAVGLRQNPGRGESVCAACAQGAAESPEQAAPPTVGAGVP